MKFKQELARRTGISEDILPSSYQIVGDIALVKLPKVNDKQKKMIGKAIMEMLPRIKSVYEILQIVEEFRKPKVKKLAGNGPITIHKEHGILYKLDVTKVMFSKGNLFERQRLIRMVRKNETVVDMFAGIGYFSLGIAKFSLANKIIAIEKNPTAFEFLENNIKLNKIKNIEPILADCRVVAPKLVARADRIIMGYLPGTEKFLPAALKMARSTQRRKCVIHFHNTYNENELWEKPIQHIRKACESAKMCFKIIKKKKVKSYAPNVFHVVIDFAVSGL